MQIYTKLCGGARWNDQKLSGWLVTKQLKSKIEMLSLSGEELIHSTMHSGD